MRKDLPAGTVTFLFTDVEGSTKLLHELGAEGYAAALAEHRLVIREACLRHDGVEVDTQGDAFFFAFPTAPGALTAADELTEALASGRIQVRIGLHTGTPLLTDEGYVGDDVHFGARVAASSHGGQVVLSSATAEAVELPLTDLGEHRLKDIEGAVSIFQLGDGSFPPLKTISNTNLPRPASSFVGREHELSEVLARIEAGARLVTLTGPGGTGKTRLALEAAATLVPEYKAGVFWVGLAALRDPALVAETISQTLGAKDRLAEHIGEREMLLLLDNLEQVIEAAPELSSLLSSCPNLTLIVTSRELLRVQGEVEYPVPPLQEPEAVSLFCERAQAEPSEEIAELCARLDSLPLAVELASARVKALSPAQILERLSQRLDLLKGGRDADPRQQTLRATIEWSYDLLSEDEQQLFARLSVFAGGCTLEAAEEVCAADLDTLQSLVEKSLLRFSNERYWMLETIREFSTYHAMESGQIADVRDRHARWFSDMVESHSDIRGGDKTALLQLEADHDNIRSALGWLHETADAAAGLQLAGGVLSHFWWVRGYMREGRSWLDTFLSLDGEPLPPVRARALSSISFLASELGDPRQAIEYAEAAVAMWTEIGDDEELLRSLNGAAYALLALERYDEATRYFDDAIERALQLGVDRWIIALSANKAEALMEIGRKDSARSLLADALQRARDANSRVELLYVLPLLGTLDAVDGRAEARDELYEGLTIATEIGYTTAVPDLLSGLAAVASEVGSLRVAVLLASAAESLGSRLGQDQPIPMMIHAREKALAAARSALAPDELHELRERGAALEFEEMIEMALTLD